MVACRPFVICSKSYAFGPPDAIPGMTHGMLEPSTMTAGGVGDSGWYRLAVMSREGSWGMSRLRMYSRGSPRQRIRGGWGGLWTLTT